MKTAVKSLLTLVALAAMPLAVRAQDAATKPATPETSERRDRGDRSGGGFEDFRKRMNERIKTSLKVSDDEWSVLQPLIEKVTEKQRDSMSGRGFGGPPRGGTPGGGTTTASTTSATTSTRPERAGTAESTALRTALDNESATPEELKSKLAAVRAARQKSTTELVAAREELRKVVTVRQEAVLVSMGILE